MDNVVTSAMQKQPRQTFSSSAIRSTPSDRVSLEFMNYGDWINTYSITKKSKQFTQGFKKLYERFIHEGLSPETASTMHAPKWDEIEPDKIFFDKETGSQAQYFYDGEQYICVLVKKNNGWPVDFALCFSWILEEKEQ